MTGNQALFVLLPIGGILLVIVFALWQIKSGHTQERPPESLYTNTEQAFDKGLRYEALGDHFNAMSLFLQVVQAKPQWAEARFHLGLSYVHLREKEKALEQYETLKSMRSDYAPELDLLI